MVWLNICAIAVYNTKSVGIQICCKAKAYVVIFCNQIAYLFNVFFSRLRGIAAEVWVQISVKGVNLAAGFE